VDLLERKKSVTIGKLFEKEIVKLLTRGISINHEKAEMK